MNQAGGDNSGTVGNSNTDISNKLGINNIIGDNTKIDIKITRDDPNFQNDKLPGYFPDLGFSGSKPAQLNDFRGAEIITHDKLVSGDADFNNRSIVIKGRTYSPVFHLNGFNRENRRVAFKLNGKQKGALFQFGVADLASATILTYQVNIVADGTTIWNGRIIYGTVQQVLSIPLNIPNVSTIVIEYIISQGGDNPHLNLVFARAEILY